MATIYNVTNISKLIREKIISLGYILNNAVIYGTDFECYVDEINCLRYSLEAINSPHLTDTEKDIVITNLYKKYSI